MSPDSQKLCSRRCLISYNVLKRGERSQPLEALQRIPKPSKSKLMPDDKTELAFQAWATTIETILTPYTMGTTCVRAQLRQPVL